MKNIFKRLCTGFLAVATILTAVPSTAVHASEKQYWTTGKETAGVIEKVMNDGSISSTFNESWFVVEGETAYCIDINTDFISGYKTRADASTRMSDDQISDVALSLEYVKQYAKTHNNLNDKQVYLLEQCVVWQRLSVHLGWQCDNVRASYDEIPKSVQDEVYAGAKAFVKENKERYECGGYIYSGQGQELGQFWAELAVGNATLKKTSSNTSITDGNGLYSIAGATYGVFSDKACKNQLLSLLRRFAFIPVPAGASASELGTAHADRLGTFQPCQSGAYHAFPVQLHPGFDSDWCLYIGRFSLSPLLPRQAETAHAPPKAGSHGA